MHEIIEMLKNKKDRFLLEKLPSKKRTAFNKIKKALDEKAFPILFGLRRVGKTTILKQFLREYRDNSIYLTFRDLYMSSLDKVEIEILIERLYEQGYRLILIDEAQIKSAWSDIVVAAFDSFPDLKMIVTGSSSLNLELKETGLDRTRKINIQTLSFGEYCYLANKAKTQENFERFLGNFGFPKYAIEDKENYEVQRSEIFDEIIQHDIPTEFRKINPSLLSRLVIVLAKKTNGEVNLSKVVKEVAPNFLQRDAFEYIDILEKSKVLKIVYRINSNGMFPKVRKFKVYFNPHIHLWIINKSFNNLETAIKGHIIESYWLFWTYNINSYSKNFFYLKDARTKQEIDFVSANNSSVGPKWKTLHEIKYTKRKNIDLSFMKQINSFNKLVWNIDGNNVDGIRGKSLLDTFDKEI